MKRFRLYFCTLYDEHFVYFNRREDAEAVATILRSAEGDFETKSVEVTERDS